MVYFLIIPFINDKKMIKKLTLPIPHPTNFTLKIKNQLIFWNIILKKIETLKRARDVFS
jgi:hypothetical protein